MASPQSFLQALAQAVSRQKGGDLSRHLSLGHVPAPTRTAVLQLAADAARVTQACTQVISKPFDQVISLHLQSLAASSQQHHVDAFKLQTKTTDLFLQYMESDKDSIWWLPLLNTLSLQLRVSSFRADEERERGGEKPKHMIEAEDKLKRFFQKMIIDRSPLAQSKKLGCLFMIVHLFKIYFRINNLRLCTNLVTIVANKQLFPPMDQFPMSQRVAYQYYYGRLMVFEEKYEQAETALEFAFKHCHSQYKANKRRVLQFLIPVKLLLGKFPHERLLEKYGLTQFISLIRSIHRGHLAQFNNALEQHQEFFIKKGIFLILEKLKTLVYRNLFRKVHLYNQAHQTDKPKNQLGLDTILAALRMYGTEMDIDELECILANLIYTNSMKGYIAHHRCVVMSKTEPFPTLHQAS